MPNWMGTNTAYENQQNIRYRVLVQKPEFIPRGTHKH